MSGYEYRIVYQIQRAEVDEEGFAEDDFVEIGFGSAGGCDIDSVVHELASDVTNFQWETEPGMPDSEDVKRDVEAARS